MRPNSIKSPLIWDLFEVTQEGASQVKESKTSLLTHIYDIFKMEDNETIKAISNRFNYIVVGPKGLGKTIEKQRSTTNFFYLLKEWRRPKVMTIEEAKGLATISMKELLGCLITCERTLQMDKEMEANKKKRT